MKLYENVVIGTFLYALGFEVRSRMAGRAPPAVINLLQQTPTDRRLADLLVQFAGSAFLIEFKRAENKSKKERNKRRDVLCAALGSGAKMLDISRDVHWQATTWVDQGVLQARVTPYIDVDAGKPLTMSLQAFLSRTADHAVSGAKRWSSSDLKLYFEFVAKCALDDVEGGGGLLCSVRDDGALCFAEVVDFRQLRLTDRQLMAYFRAQDQMIDRLSQELRRTFERDLKQKPDLEKELDRDNDKDANHGW